MEEYDQWTNGQIDNAIFRREKCYKENKQSKMIKSKWGAVVDLVVRKSLSEEVTFQQWFWLDVVTVDHMTDFYLM